MASGHATAGDLGNFDRTNLRAFTTFGAIGYFNSLHGWLDPGEQALIEAAAQGLVNPAVLDIGVGTGRTIPMMQALAGSYVAIDMAAKMVETARRLHPDADARHMDARALDFPDAAFDLVTFSYNGLDSVTPPDRNKVLAEVARVTRPGGVFAFSSLNRDGPGFGEKYALARPRPGRRGGRELLRVAAKSAFSYWNYRRNQRFHTDQPGLAVRTSAAHNYGVVAVFVSLRTQVAALAQHGFVVEQVFSPASAASLPLDRDDTTATWLHYLARRQP